jgi:hypothetical protein
MIVFKDQGMKQEDIIKQTWLEEKLEEEKISLLLEQLEEKYFDYFVFNIIGCSVNCGFPRSGARRRVLAHTIGNARGLDINSPRSAKNNLQDLRFC